MPPDPICPDCGATDPADSRYCPTRDCDGCENCEHNFHKGGTDGESTDHHGRATSAGR